MKRKKIFTGKRLKLFTELKKMPDGSRVYHEEINHPGASLVVPIIKGKIAFIRQYRAVIDKYIWELPAGVLEKGESPYGCAKREVVEETGCIPDKIRKIGKIYTSPGFTDEVIHIFLAECSSRGASAPDDDEFLTVKLMSRKQIRELFSKGKITDSKTIAALSFAGYLR